jgi:hypothetical protein
MFRKNENRGVVGSLIILLFSDSTSGSPDLCFLTQKLASPKLIGIPLRERRVTAHLFSLRGYSLSPKLRGCRKVLYEDSSYMHRHTKGVK